MDFGIPFGGFFIGAEGIKTEEEAEIYGGGWGTIWSLLPFGLRHL
jgi:hypothetical protein